MEENTIEHSAWLAQPVQCVSATFRDESSCEEPVDAHPVAAHDISEVPSPPHDVAPRTSSSSFEEASHQQNIACSDSVASSSGAFASSHYKTPLLQTMSQVHGALLQEQRTSTAAIDWSRISFGPFGKGGPEQPLVPRPPSVPTPDRAGFYLFEAWLQSR